MSTKQPAKGSKSSAGKGKSQSAPKGSISATIYDAIEKLVADQGLSRAAAFRQLAKTTGRKEGTVAVNYYYAAKKRGAKLQKRRPAGKSSMAARGAGQSRVLSLLKSLEELIRQQATELDALRRENGRFAEIRKLLGRA